MWKTDAVRKAPDQGSPLWWALLAIVLLPPLAWILWPSVSWWW